MSTDSNKVDQTQPIKVSGDKTISEDTSEINVVPEKISLSKEIPDWLIEFASEPTQDVEDQIQHGLEAIEEPSEDSLEAASPIVLETAEWHTVQAELENSVTDFNQEAISSPTEQSVQDHLGQGNFDAAADLILKTATNKKLAGEAQRTLRSHLLLQEERLPLWNVYDQLSEMFNQATEEN